MSHTHPIPDGAKVGLIGVIFDPNNIETPWLVQDNRKALKNEHPCHTKADVVDKIAEILDEMSHPPANWSEATTMPRWWWQSPCKQACAI